jgi:hypothetical protein
LSKITEEGLFAMAELTGLGAAEPGEEARTLSPLLTMTPGEREKLKLMEQKISKMGYKCKMRFIYVAEKDKMVKSRGINPIMGAMKQFNIQGVNGLKPELKKTSVRANYFFVKRRTRWKKNRIMAAYKSRSADIGMPMFIFNVEELASIWHFPNIFVKTPLVKMAEMKRTTPPVTLPFESTDEETEVELPFETEEDTEVPSETTATVPTFDYDTDYFEEKFAKNKARYKEKQAEQQREEPTETNQPVIEEEKANNEHETEINPETEFSKGEYEEETETPGSPPPNLPFVQ